MGDFLKDLGKTLGDFNRTAAEITKARGEIDNIGRTGESTEGVRTTGNKVATSSNEIAIEQNRQRLENLKNGGYGGYSGGAYGNNRTDRTTEIYRPDGSGGSTTIIQNDRNYGNGGYSSPRGGYPYNDRPYNDRPYNDQYNRQDGNYRSNDNYNNSAGRRGVNTDMYPNDVSINGKISQAEAERALSQMSNEERVALARGLQDKTNIQIFSRTGGVRSSELAAAATEFVKSRNTNMTALEQGDLNEWRKLESQVIQNGKGSRGNNNYDWNGPIQNNQQGSNSMARNNNVIDREELINGYNHLSDDKKTAFVRNMGLLTGKDYMAPGNKFDATKMAEDVTKHVAENFKSVNPLEKKNASAAWNQLADHVATTVDQSSKTLLEPLKPSADTSKATAQTQGMPYSVTPNAKPTALESRLNGLVNARLNSDPDAQKWERDMMRQEVSDTLGNSLTLVGKTVPKGTNPLATFSEWMETKRPDLAATIKTGTPKEAEKAMDTGMVALQKDAELALAAYKKNGAAVATAPTTTTSMPTTATTTTPSQTTPITKTSTQPVTTKTITLNADEQKLATEVTTKFNQKLSEYQNAGLFDDAKKAEMFGEAKMYLNKVGMPTNDGNVVQNAITYGVRNNPQQVRTILDNIDNPMTMVTKVMPAVNEIVGGIKQQAAKEEAKKITIKGAIGNGIDVEAMGAASSNVARSQSNGLSIG